MSNQSFAASKLQGLWEASLELTTNEVIRSLFLRVSVVNSFGRVIEELSAARVFAEHQFHSALCTVEAAFQAGGAVFDEQWALRLF